MQAASSAISFRLSAVSPLQMTTSAHPFPLPFVRFLWAFRSALARFASAFFPQAFRFLSSASCPRSGYSAHCSSFQLSSRFSSQRLPGAPRFLSSSGSFRLTFRLVFRPDLWLLLTQLPVCFLSSFPASLPQLFHRCSPFALTQAFSMALPFFRPFTL